MEVVLSLCVSVVEDGTGGVTVAGSGEGSDATVVVGEMGMEDFRSEPACIGAVVMNFCISADFACHDRIVLRYFLKASLAFKKASLCARSNEFCDPVGEVMSSLFW